MSERATRGRRVPLQQGRDRWAAGIKLSARGVADWCDAAAAGDPEAQFVLGRFYLEGAAGLPRDPSLARRWFGWAARARLAVAQIELAKMEEAGIGSPVDRASAARWYRSAAEQGHTGAQRRYGHLLWHGIGVSQDRGEAVKWWARAAEQGDALAKRYLAPLLWRGEYVVQDRRRAWQYVRDAVSDPVVWSILGTSESQRRGTRRLAALLTLVALFLVACLIVVLSHC